MDKYFSSDSLYVVFFIILIIWLGIGSYFFKVDRKLTKLEKSHEEHLKK